jgi:ubiquinone/menaquinone biosynthesis C-methylase UbiE
MVEVAESPCPQIVLDVGCGKGELLRIIGQKLSGFECVGIDIGDAIYEAKRRTTLARLRNVQLVRADCLLLPFRSESLEMVFCASVLEHLLDALPAVLEIERILVTDGRLVVGMPTENRVYRILRKIARLEKPKNHYHEGAQLEELLLSRFTNTESFVLPFSLLPRFLSLYIILLCTKKSGKNTPACENTDHNPS